MSTCLLKNKKGLSMIELIAGLVLTSLISVMLASTFYFVWRTTNLVYENGGLNTVEIRTIETVVTPLNEFNPSIAELSNAGRTITFRRNSYYEYDETKTYLTKLDFESEAVPAANRPKLVMTYADGLITIEEYVYDATTKTSILDSSKTRTLKVASGAFSITYQYQQSLVGGVYTNDLDAEGNPIISYYIVEFDFVVVSGTKQGEVPMTYVIKAEDVN